MPTIAPQLRASIGNSDQPASHRASLTAATGMTMPTTQSTSAPKTGHPGITEETTAPAVTLSPQLTALARRQQKFQQEVQAQREKESQWEKDKANYVPKESFKAKVQQNAVEALSDLGLTYDELTNLLLNQQNGADPVRELRSEVDQLKKSQEESANKQFEAILNQYKSEAQKLIQSSDKYLMIRDEPEAAKAAVDELVADWEKDGETKDISYYLDLAEEGLRDMANALSGRLSKTKPAEETAQPTKKTLPPPKAAQTRTLTQQVETAPQQARPGQFQHLSMKERIAQATARAQR